VEEHMLIIFLSKWNDVALTGNGTYIAASPLGAFVS
jgi:hypothetical protein